MNTQDIAAITAVVMAALEAKANSKGNNVAKTAQTPPSAPKASKWTQRNIERGDKSETYNKAFANEFRKNAVANGLKITRKGSGKGAYKLGHGIVFTFKRADLGAFDKALADLRIVFKDRAKKSQPRKSAVTPKRKTTVKTPPSQGVADNSIAALLAQNAALLARLEKLESKTAVEFPTASETKTIRANVTKNWVTLGAPTAAQAQKLSYITAMGDSVPVHDGAQFLLGKRNSTIAAAGALLKSGNNVNAAIFGTLQRGKKSPLQKNNSANADLRKAARQALGILASDGVTSTPWEVAGEGAGIMYQNSTNRVYVNYTQKTLEWGVIA